MGDAVGDAMKITETQWIDAMEGVFGDAMVLSAMDYPPSNLNQHKLFSLYFVLAISQHKIVP